MVDGGMGWEPPTLMLVRGVFSANPGPAIRGDRRCQAPRRARASGSTRIRRGPLLRDRDPLGFRHSDRDGAVGPERSVPTGPLVDGPPPSTGATQLMVQCGVFVVLRSLLHGKLCCQRFRRRFLSGRQPERLGTDSCRTPFHQVAVGVQSMALRLNVSLNEVMVCGALIRPVYVLSSDELLVEYKLLSSRREPVVSPTGDSECDSGLSPLGPERPGVSVSSTVRGPCKRSWPCG